MVAARNGCAERVAAEWRGTSSGAWEVAKDERKNKLHSVEYKYYCAEQYIYEVSYTGIKSRTNRALGFINLLSRHVFYCLLRLDRLMWWFGYWLKSLAKKFKDPHLGLLLYVSSSLFILTQFVKSFFFLLLVLQYGETYRDEVTLMRDISYPQDGLCLFTLHNVC